MHHTHPLRGITRFLPGKPPGAPSPVHGGCIHRSWKWGPYFVKTNDLTKEDVFAGEAAGLRAIAECGVIRVPEVIALGTSEDLAFLILEHLPLAPTGNEALLGEQLAALHRVTRETHGFDRNNHIGSTPQRNPPTSDWAEFFRDHRIAPKVRALASAGIVIPGSEALLERITGLLPRHPTPSLLHGDLWGGNRAYLPDGTPVLFDPACYFGHAECDLAMTGLFGGFGPAFRDAYRAVSGSDETSLHEIYNLYHILNHALLFGGGYVSQAAATVRRLVP